jgi:hypothetical protein
MDMDTTTANYNHALATAVNAVIFHMYLSPKKRQIVTDADAAAIQVITDTLCTISVHGEVGSNVTSQDVGATNGDMHPGVKAAMEAMKAAVSRDGGEVAHAQDLDAVAHESTQDIAPLAQAAE